MEKTMLGIELIKSIADVYKTGNKVLICGNGGLASLSEHFAAELMGKFAFERYIPCIALTQNTSLITAVSNDLGFENVFSHQISVLGNSGDVLIAMTTSRSVNVLKAVEIGRRDGLITAVICGNESGEFDADYIYKMHSNEVAAIQNEILSFLHYIAYNVKRRLR